MRDGKAINPNTINLIVGYDKEIYVKPYKVEELLKLA